MENKVSDEILNAYIDDQLDGCDIELIQSLVENDPELESRVNELRRLKIMVRMARPVVNTEDLPGCTDTTAWWNRHLALAATLFVCVTASSLLYWQYDQRPLLPEVASVEGVMAQIAQSNAESEVKLILHVRYADRTSTAALLQQVEALLAQARHHQRHLRIEVVANGKGLDLLRKDRSPYPHRISQLHASHDNLSFLACSDTLKQLKIKGEKNIPLLPQATVVNSVNKQIEMRRRQGWAYITA